MQKRPLTKTGILLALAFAGFLVFDLTNAVSFIQNKLKAVAEEKDRQIKRLADGINFGPVLVPPSDAYPKDEPPNK